MSDIVLAYYLLCPKGHSNDAGDMPLFIDKPCKMISWKMLSKVAQLSQGSDAEVSGYSKPVACRERANRVLVIML